MPKPSPVKTESEIWPDGEQWMLYTRDTKLIREIRGWDAFKDKRIRQMGTYHNSVEHCLKEIYCAVQFRFVTRLKDRVCRAAGLPLTPRKAVTAKQLEARKAAGLASAKRRRRQQENKAKRLPGAIVSASATPKAQMVESREKRAAATQKGTLGR